MCNGVHLYEFAALKSKNLLYGVIGLFFVPNSRTQLSSNNN